MNTREANGPKGMQQEQQVIQFCPWIYKDRNKNWMTSRSAVVKRFQPALG